jgi:hypothetical protein
MSSLTPDLLARIAQRARDARRRYMMAAEATIVRAIQRTSPSMSAFHPLPGLLRSIRDVTRDEQQIDSYTMRSHREAVLAPRGPAIAKH